MPSLLRLMKSSFSRKLVSTTLGASATASSTSQSLSIPIPPSATFLQESTASIQASQATSAALSELSKHWDTCLSEIGDLDGDLSSERRFIERRLTEESEKYLNSSLHPNLVKETSNGVPKPESQVDAVKEWNCTRDEAQMVSIAMKLSDTAYDADRDPEKEEGFVFAKKKYIPATVNGTTKATTFTIVTLDKNVEGEKETQQREEFPLLVIAIKGSRSAADWMVNSNGNPTKINNFFDLSSLSAARAAPPPPPPPLDIKAHSGFLHCARALLPHIKTHLLDFIKTENAHNVLFTGHSAGGAVSSLLFTHFLSISAKEYKNIKFNLITFGAPPVISPDLTPFLRNYKSATKGNILAICNEYDPVPRADSAYIHSLLDLHRSAYGLPPLPEVSIQEEYAEEATPAPIIPTSSSSNSVTKSHIVIEQTQISPDSRSATEISLSLSTSAHAKSPAMPGSLRRRVTSTGEWILPNPLLHPLGRVIVLEDKNIDVEDLDLYAYEVQTAEFEKLLFVKVGVHRRGVYLENVEKVKGGFVNGRQGWGR